MKISDKINIDVMKILWTVLAQQTNQTYGTETY